MGLDQGNINTYENADDQINLIKPCIMRAFQAKVPHLAFRMNAMSEHAAEFIYDFLYSRAVKFEMHRTKYGYANNVDFMIYC